MKYKLVKNKVSLLREGGREDGRDGQEGGLDCKEEGNLMGQAADDCMYCWTDDLGNSNH